MGNVHATPIGSMPFVRDTVSATPSRQAYQLLHFAFTAAPIIAGLDKFFDFLVDWDKYLAPWFANMLPAGLGAHTFLMLVGVIEVIAGLIVAFRPRVGAWIVFAWLWAIIINLLSYPGYFDIALRDFGLSLGAMALARLSMQYDAKTD